MLCRDNASAAAAMPPKVSNGRSSVKRGSSPPRRLFAWWRLPHATAAPAIRRGKAVERARLGGVCHADTNVCPQSSRRHRQRKWTTLTIFTAAPFEMRVRRSCRDTVTPTTSASRWGLLVLLSHRSCSSSWWRALCSWLRSCTHAQAGRHAQMVRAKKNATTTPPNPQRCINRAPSRTANACTTCKQQWK